MEKMNLCNGCFYAGCVDGFMPECTNCTKAMAYKENTDKENTDVVIRHTDWCMDDDLDLLIFGKLDECLDSPVSEKSRGLSRNRHHSMVRERNRAQEISAITKNKNAVEAAKALKIATKLEKEYRRLSVHRQVRLMIHSKSTKYDPLFL